jgi:hypothetical protein
MKKTLLSYLLILLSHITLGQWSSGSMYDLNFEDTANSSHLRIDTTSNPNNIWQVGLPQKTNFTSAYSPQYAIVTDTLNSYPVNDTSVFTLVNIQEGSGFFWHHTVILSGMYNVNSDSLTDFGLIEFSPDNGTTWIDLINDSTYSTYLSWYTPPPVLTGNSNGWQSFYVNLANLGIVFNIPDGDTVLYRFTFISDSVQTNKDGLMFDNFHFEDYFEGIDEIQNNNLISIAPNPTSDKLFINSKTSFGNERIQIMDCTGKMIIDTKNFSDKSINTSALANGIYFLKYSNDKNYSIKKFILRH